jgi:hypothetical protein
MTADRNDRRVVAAHADEARARELAEQQYRRDRARTAAPDVSRACVEVTVHDLDFGVEVRGDLDAVAAWVDAEWFRTGADLAMARQWRDSANSRITKLWGAVDEFLLGDEAAAGRAHVAARWNRAYVEHLKRRYS